MEYAEVRPLIKSGDLIAFSHKGWKTWHDIKVQIVRMFTQSEYSHVACAWAVGDRVFLIEAVEPCVRIFPLSKCGDFYWIPLKADWTPKVEEFALSLVGAEYKQLHAILAFFKPLKKSDVSECAALVIRIARKFGCFLGARQTPDAVVEAAMLQGNTNTLVVNKPN